MIFSIDINIDDLKPNFSGFSLTYTCIMLYGILLLVISKRELGIFIKINTYGVIFVTLNLFFIMTMGVISFTNTDFIIENKDNKYD